MRAEPCSTCSGRGVVACVWHATRDHLHPCPDCNGSGKAELCVRHGTKIGRQNVKRIAVEEDLPYPRQNLGTTEGDASELECPYCGLANDIADEDGTVRAGAFECGHCGQWFDIESVVVIARASKSKNADER